MHEDTSTGGELTARQQFWLAHLRDAQAAGVTLKAYAETHGLKVASLYNHRKELRRRGVLPASSRRSPRMARVVVEVPQPAVCRAHLRNGCTLEWTGSPDEAQLAGWLRALEALG